MHLARALAFSCTYTRTPTHTNRDKRMHAHTHRGLHQLNSLAHLFLLMQQIKLLYRRRKHTRDTVLWQSTQPRLLSSTPEGNGSLGLPQLYMTSPTSSNARLALVLGELILLTEAHGSHKDIPLHGSPSPAALGGV